MEKKLYRFIGVFIAQIIRFRYPVLVLTLISAAFMSNGLRHATLNQSYKAYLSEANRHMQMILHMEENYIKDENVLIVMKPDSGTIFEQGALLAIREMTEAAWKLPGVIRVDSLNNYQFTAAENDELLVDALVPEDADITPGLISRVKTIALNEPQLRGLLVSEDGSTTAVSLIFNYNDQDFLENLRMEMLVREMIANFQARYPGITFHHTGILSAHAETTMMAKHDVMTLFGIAGIVVLAGIYLFLRSLPATVACILVIILTVLSTGGLVGYSQTSFTLVTSCSPILIMTLAVADSIHILMSVLSLMREGMEKNEAIIESFKSNFLAIFLTSVTTIVGFLTFNFSIFEPLVGLGNIVSVGIFLAFVFTLLFIPAFLSIVPVPQPRQTGKNFVTVFTEWLSRVIIEYRKPLVITSIFISVLAAMLISRGTIRDNYFTFYSDSAEYLKGSLFTEEHLTGAGNLIIAIENDEPESVNSTDFLARVEQLCQWLNRQPYIRHVYSYTDVLKRINKNMHGDDAAFYRLPETKELAAQYLLLYELSLPFGLDMGNQINQTKSGIRIVTAVNIEDSTLVRERVLALEKKLTELFPNETYYYGGGNILVNYYIYDNMIAVLTSAIVAFAIIGLVLIITFRSILIGLIGMLGTFLPLVVFFGFWCLFAGDIGLSASLAIGVAIGIVVDNSVHLISKTTTAIRVFNQPPSEAVAYSLTKVAPALICNTLVLGTGFFILYFADYGPNSTLGIMSSLTFLLALITCFLLIAPLLSYLRPERRELFVEAAQQI